VASVGRFEASGAKDHVIFGYRNDCCGFWFDPPIQPLAKRYLLVKESRQQRGVNKEAISEGPSITRGWRRRS
jgi:hypothetical protein